MTEKAVGTLTEEQEPTATDEQAPRRRDPLRIFIKVAPFVGLVCSIALVVIGLSTGVLESRENLQAFIGSLGIWGPVVFMIASVASTVFPIVPAGLLVLAAPIMFGPVWGTIYNYVSISAGSCLNFAIARHLGLSLIERVFSPERVEKYLGWTRKPHFTTAFATAIVLPVAPDDLLCYLAGTTRMSWRTFVLIILLGKPWAIIAYGLGVSAIVFSIFHW